ncbi:MAG: hypothetical protein AB2826_19500 [Candidatus Thiodiazotropha sp.]
MVLDFKDVFVLIILINIFAAVEMNKNIVKASQHTSQKCKRVEAVLLRRGRRVELVQKALALISVLFGLLVIASFVPAVKAVLKESVSYITFIASVVLIFQAIMFFWFHKAGPERYKDFATYIGKYADDIEKVLIKEEEEEKEKLYEAKLLVIIDMALENIRHARRVFGSIEKEGGLVFRRD